ncbi:MAG: hypothetical protein IPH58_11625 [Sphingobacteriales bacterium]|nr:hypothetical protein [Sphingobacteriales bacterium]
MIYKTMMLFAVVVGLTFTLFSCTTTQSPTRKKMPNYLNDAAFESGAYFRTNGANKSDAFNLVTNNENILLAGVSVPMISVSLASPMYDDAILNMVAEYKPIAALLLTNWVAQGNNGAVLDFRTVNSNQAMEAQYYLKRAASTSIPVVFRWDKNSAARAQTYMSLLTDVPGIKIIKVN